MMTRALHRWAVGAGALLLFASLAWVFLNLPAPTAGLREPVMTRLADSGVRHPVTAVLLNFRGYDTLLEIGVLLLAAFGALSLRASERAPPRAAPPHALLAALTRALAPLMILTAGYLLWAGARQPGGAFQAGAVLAALGVLLRLSGVLPAFTPPPAWLRFGLVFGFAVFL
ncbi:MAG: MnhB domain-containing protein, partial [Pseudomonadota bacterium]